VAHATPGVVADSQIVQSSKIPEFDRSLIRNDGAGGSRRDESAPVAVHESFLQKASEFEAGLSIASLGLEPQICNPIVEVPPERRSIGCRRAGC
jgi:hypothetical protein